VRTETEHEEHKRIHTYTISNSESEETSVMNKRRQVVSVRSFYLAGSVTIQIDIPAWLRPLDSHEQEIVLHRA
jgi:hypothetical protein